MTMRRKSLWMIALCTLWLLLGATCPFAPLPNGDDAENGLNTTDPTNGGAEYIGSATCAACHPTYAEKHRIHGHSQKLQKLSGSAPTYPDEGTRAGIPNPPDGKAWTDITYVIGGYYRKGRFIDSDGYVMTDGVDGVNTQWNLDFPPTGTVAGWTTYSSSQVDPKPYGHSCFKCHTTGPSEDGNQDDLVGIQGTFAEPGVQCEACHGPGSRHAPNPPRNIYVNDKAEFCGACHSRGDDMNVIPVKGGFIRHHEQYQELLASPHAGLRCITCHATHTSTAYDRDNAIINDCSACHAGQDLAFHEGKVFERGDYVETVRCESCHMPYATKSATAATEDVVGAMGARMGDIRTHIFNINRIMVGFNAMFDDDGNSVKKDANGQAAVTLDFVCLRCHNGKGNAFALSLRTPGDTPPTMPTMHK